MSLTLLALVIALTTVLLAEFVNGWTDAPNVIATVVSTGAVSPRVAIVMAVVFNVLGAMGGTAVAATVGKGIVAPSSMTLPAISATMVSIIAWGTFAARFGIPVSKSHALLAGLAGAGLAGGGWEALQWTGWQKVGLGLICSLALGFCGALAIGKVVIAVSSGARPIPAKRSFKRLQVVSAAFMAFNHGLNDGQKFMGVFALTMLAGGATTVFEIPFWIILVCALTMGIGTSFGGWRIIETVGMKMARISSWAGVCSADFSRIHNLRCLALRHPAEHDAHHYNSDHRCERLGPHLRCAVGRLAPDPASLVSYLSPLRHDCIPRSADRQWAIRLKPARFSLCLTPNTCKNGQCMLPDRLGLYRCAARPTERDWSC